MLHSADYYGVSLVGYAGPGIFRSSRSVKIIQGFHSRAGVVNSLVARQIQSNYVQGYALAALGNFSHPQLCLVTRRGL